MEAAIRTGRTPLVPLFENGITVVAGRPLARGGLHWLSKCFAVSKLLLRSLCSLLNAFRSASYPTDPVDYG